MKSKSNVRMFINNEFGAGGSSSVRTSEPRPLHPSLCHPWFVSFLFQLCGLMVPKWLLRLQASHPYIKASKPGRKKVAPHTFISLSMEENLSQRLPADLSLLARIGSCVHPETTHLNEKEQDDHD